MSERRNSHIKLSTFEFVKCLKEKNFSRLTVEENLRLGAYINEQGKHFETDIKEVYDLFPVLASRKTQRGWNIIWRRAANACYW